MAKGPEASTDFSTEYSPHLGQTLNIKISLSSEASALDGLLSHANRKCTPGLIIQAFHCLRHFDLKMQVRRDDERAENCLDKWDHYVRRFGPLSIPAKDGGGRE